MTDDWFDPVKGIRPYGKNRYFPYRTLKGTATPLMSAEAYAFSGTCAYIRVSTSEQGKKGLSLATQVLIARECVQRLGLPPIGILICDVDSASDHAHRPRPGWELLNQMIERGEVKRVLVLSLDRLSRKGPREVIPFVYKLLDRKVDLVWTSPNETPPVGYALIDLLLLSIKAEEARQTSCTISNKVTGAIRTAYLSGQPPKGVKPYGYQLVNGHAVPSEPEATVVRTAYELAMDPAMSLKQIAAHMNQMAPKGDQWNTTRLARMLRNTMMAGFRVAPPSLHDDPEVPPMVTLQDWEPLVSRHTWDVVQTRLAASPVQKRLASLVDSGLCGTRRAAVHPLAGLGRCSGCGSRLTVRKGKTQDEPAMYVCPKGRSEKCSHTGALPVAQVVECVLGLLKDQLVSRPARSIVAEWVQRSDARTVRLRRLTEKFRVKLSAVDEQLNNLLGIIPQIPAAEWYKQERLQHRFSELTQVRELLLRRLEPAEEKLEAYAEAMHVDITWVRRQKRLAGKLLRSPAGQQQPLLDQLVHAVSVDFIRQTILIKLRTTPFSPAPHQPKAGVWFRAKVPRFGQQEPMRRWHPKYGALPHGFGNVNGQLVVIPEEAEIVRLVYREAAIGSRKTVVAALAKLAGASALGPKPWDQNRVNCTIRNPRYCGMVLPRRNGRACRLSRCRASEFPPIVSREEWLAAQSPRTTAKRAKRR